VKDQVKEKALQIVEVIFNKMLHTQHFNRVQFSAMNKLLRRPNQTLGLVVLTWLRQLQQFICDKNITNNGDWNKHVKYCGTTTNRMEKFAPLANMNFCTRDKQLVLVPILSVEVFKPAEGKEGVCTSLEVWALRILNPRKNFN
jgi:hypothetical protein